MARDAKNVENSGKNILRKTMGNKFPALSKAGERTKDDMWPQLLKSHPSKHNTQIQIQICEYKYTNTNTQIL